MPAKLDLFLASELPLDVFAGVAEEILKVRWRAGAAGYEAVLDEQPLLLRPVSAALDSETYARRYRHVIVLDARGVPPRRVIAIGRRAFERFREAGHRAALAFGTDIALAQCDPAPAPGDAAAG